MEFTSSLPQPPCKEEDVDDDDFFASNPPSDDDVFKPRAQLPESTPFMRELRWIIRSLDDGTIDVQPEYQREVVWTAERMTGLIDSLMENYYIPPIILNMQKVQGQIRTTPSITYVCVDGKQRLSSVRAFVKGLIPCTDHRGYKWWYTNISTSKRRKVLDERTREAFLNKQFAAFEFKDLSPEQEEELFARVQKGMQLTLAEKMRAQNGPWQELAKMFVEDFDAVFSLLKDRSRGKDFQFALACFSQILEVQHPSSANGKPALKTNFKALPKLLENKDAVNDETKSHLANVFKTFRDLVEEKPAIFNNEENYLTTVRTFSPLEMVAVAVLISEYAETRNNSLLLGDIRYLRIWLRQRHVDLRLNTTLWADTWRFMGDLELFRGAVNGSTINRNAISPPAESMHSGTSVAPQHTAVLPPESKRGQSTLGTKKSHESTPSIGILGTSSSGSRQRKRVRTVADTEGSNYSLSPLVSDRAVLHTSSVDLENHDGPNPDSSAREDLFIQSPVRSESSLQSGATPNQRLLQKSSTFTVDGQRSIESAQSRTLKELSLSSKHTILEESLQRTAQETSGSSSTTARGHVKSFGTRKRPISTSPDQPPPANRTQFPLGGNAGTRSSDKRLPTNRSAFAQPRITVGPSPKQPHAEVKAQAVPSTQRGSTAASLPASAQPALVAQVARKQTSSQQSHGNIGGGTVASASNLYEAADFNDLTDDTETERQSLLSSFKGRSTFTTQPRAKTFTSID